MKLNSTHDLGGKPGFGPIVREENEPVFHEDWEKHALALARATMGGGYYNLDEFRHAQERMEPSHYLGSSYYEHWLEAAVIMLTEKGVITADELAARMADLDANTTPAAPAEPAERPGGLPVVNLDMVRTFYKTPGAARMKLEIEPRFKVGDRIVARHIETSGHTRRTRYIGGKTGVIERDLGVFHLPDSRVCGDGDQPQHTYFVRFEARELWGDEAPANDALIIALWDDYMDPA